MNWLKDLTDEQIEEAYDANANATRSTFLANLPSEGHTAQEEAEAFLDVAMEAYWSILKGERIPITDALTLQYFLIPHLVLGSHNLIANPLEGALEYLSQIAEKIKAVEEQDSFAEYQKQYEEAMKAEEEARELEKFHESLEEEAVRLKEMIEQIPGVKDLKVQIIHHKDGEEVFNSQF